MDGTPPSEAHVEEVPMNHHRITKLSVTGGYLDGMDLRLEDGLVCFIGPRGSGKTTVLELLRFALGLAPKDEGNNRQRVKRFENLVAANLGQGRIDVDFETKEGLVYHVQRSADEEPLVTDSDGDPVDSAILDARSSIDIAVYGQNEVEDIATQPGFLRAVLDRFCAGELSDVQGRIRRATVALQRNATEVIQLSDKKTKGHEAVRTLPELESRLVKIVADLAAAKLGDDLDDASKGKALRTKESAALARVAPAITDARSELAPLSRGIIGEFKQVFTDEILQGPHGQLFGGLRDQLRQGVARLQAAIKEIDASLDKMSDAATEATASLQKAHQPAEVRYQALVKKAADFRAKLRDRDTLNKQVAELKARKQEQDHTGKRLAASLEERKTMLDDLSSLCEERYRVRDRVAKNLTGRLAPKIQVSVQQDAEQAAYRSFLVDRRPRTGGRYNENLNRVSQNIAPRQLADLVCADDAMSLSEHAGIEFEFAVNLVQELRSDPQYVRDLEVIALEDLPKIELDLGGGQWRPSEQLSTGQMCSVVLPLLLLESAAPLVIDQPEDNLDNRFVADTVVGFINKFRADRQMVFITHNPNIPVLGQANQVVVMDSDGRRGEVLAHGDVDAMRTHIVDLLEGGREAFETRKERYGC